MPIGLGRYRTNGGGAWQRRRGKPRPLPKRSLETLHINLFQDDKPVWYVHPGLGHKCDVIAIETHWPKQQSHLWHRAINTVSGDRIPVEPGVPVFILGYLRGIEVKLCLPVWKAGYIASEPFFPITLEQDPAKGKERDPLEGLPAFFIDSQTRPGMSGAPVIAQYTGTWDLTDPYKTPSIGGPSPSNMDHLVLGGTATEFVGCYSGRVLSSDLDPGLGLCWRTEVIEEICAARHFPANPHIL